MDTDEILFSLPEVRINALCRYYALRTITLQRYVRRYAHCEYGEDFLIFDRFMPHALEIWRLESTEWNGEYPKSEHKPDALMLHISRIINKDMAPGQSRRGVFAPWALFHPPHNPRAYRFVYPTLLVASDVGRELYLFDVPSASLIKTIPIPQHGLPPDAFQSDGTLIILYVEIGLRHVFVCTRSNVLIIPRDWNPSEPEYACSLDFPTNDPDMRILDFVRHSAARLVLPEDKNYSNDSMTRLALRFPNDDGSSNALVSLSPRVQEFCAGK